MCAKRCIEKEVESTLKAFQDTINSAEDFESAELNVLFDSQLAKSVGQIQQANERTLAGLVARLNTFSGLSWSVKPTEVSPVVCALHGWIAKEVDLLVCVTCKNNLCIRLPGSTLLCQRYVGEIVGQLLANHDDLCPWKLRIGVNPGPILRFNDPKSDFDVLLKLVEGLTTLTTEISEGLLFDIEFSAADEFLEFVTEATERRRCFELAVTGWFLPRADCLDEGLQGTRRSRSVLACRFCQRRLGLWNLRRLAARQLRSEEEKHESLALDASAFLAGATGQLEASQTEPMDLSVSLSDAPDIEPSQSEEANLEPSQSEEANLEPSQSEEANLEPSQSEAAKLDHSQLGAANVEASQSDATNLEPNQLEAANLETSQSAADELGTNQSAAASPPPTVSHHDAINLCASQSDASQPPSKRPRVSIPDSPPSAVFAENPVTLRPLSLHWHWCPWRSGEATSAWCRSVLYLRGSGNSALHGTSTKFQGSALEACAKVTRLLREIC